MTDEELEAIIEDFNTPEIERQEAMLTLASRRSLRETIVNWNGGQTSIHTRGSGTFKKTHAVEGNNFVD